MEVSKARGSFVDPTLAKVTVSEWMEIWLASRKDLRATSRTRVEGIVEKQARPKLGRTPIGQLSRLEVQRWAAELPGAPDTIRKMVNVLSGALQLAVEDGRIVANPAVRLKLPKVVRSKKRYLSQEQVAALALAVDARSSGAERGYGLIVMVLSYCGLRWGELSGLRPIDVDLPRAHLEIRQTVVMDKGYQRVEAPNDHEHRSIPIPGFLLEPLRSQIAERTPEASAFFGARTRTWLRNRSFRDGWFDPAADTIGQTGLTPHELRHTAASLAVQAGASVKAVPRTLGHASAAITLDVSADLFDDDVAVALDRAALQTDVDEMGAKRF